MLSADRSAVLRHMEPRIVGEALATLGSSEKIQVAANMMRLAC